MMVAQDDAPLPGMPEPPRPIEEPWDELRNLAIQLRCEHCAAKPGEWCRTRTGHGASDLHTARMLTVRAVFWLGYSHGFAHGEDKAGEHLP